MLLWLRQGRTSIGTIPPECLSLPKQSVAPPVAAFAELLLDKLKQFGPSRWQRQA